MDGSQFAGLYQRGADAFAENIRRAWTLKRKFGGEKNERVFD
jgi:hypothetical protein